MKILHLSDIHARDKDINEVERCLYCIVGIAHEEKPDLIVHAGDTFDDRNIKADSRSAKLIFRIFANLASIAPVAVLIGTPYHDGRTAEILSYIKAKYPVWVSAKPEQLYLAEGDLHTDPSKLFAPAQAPVEAVISMCPAPTKQFFDTNSDIKGSDAEIAQAMSVMFAGFAAQVSAYHCPHILVGHWNTTGSLISETQVLTGVDIEISKEQMALANADLVCLGHIHKQQKLKPNIFYSGSIYPTTWGEMDEKGFYIHEIGQIPPGYHYYPVESKFLLTPARKLLKLEADLTEDGAFEELDTTLYSESAENLKDSYLRVELKVYQDEAQKVDTGRIVNFFLSGGVKEVDVKLIRIPRENVRSKNILKLSTLREKLIEQASLKKETVSKSILAKADLLEAETSDKIITSVVTG